jgi:hypothetical protein
VSGLHREPGGQAAARLVLILERHRSACSLEPPFALDISRELLEKPLSRGATAASPEEIA